MKAEELNQYFKKNFHAEATFSVASSGLMPDELNQNDLKIYQAFTSQKRKKDFLMGRKALYGFFDDPEQSNFIGKTHPRFSVSHSSGVAVAYHFGGKTCSGVGVDLEYWRDSLYKGRHLFATKEEISVCQNQMDYLKLWTAKESVYKSLNREKVPLLNIRCADAHHMTRFVVDNVTVACCVLQSMDFAVAVSHLLE